MRNQTQQDPRIKKRLPCDLFFDGSRRSGIVLNVSRSGLFVQTTISAQPGANVAIDLVGPGGDSLEVDATVVWKRVVGSELMSVARGGIGLHIKRASSGYYDYLQNVSSRTPARPSSDLLRRYHVRVKLEGRPRSRTLTVFAECEGTARDQALQEVGEGWSVIDLEKRPLD